MADPTTATEAATEANRRLEHAKKKFIDTLRTIFQFDAADLDFGIYRILNMRREALEKFLVEDLTPQVESLLGSREDRTRSALEDELEAIGRSLHDLGVDPLTSSKWQAAQAKLSALPDTTTLAREVFSDLTTFFGRYYDDGDFMALPRYKADTYAIPYDGSEVKLHWANADQYYVKSTEVFGKYAVKLSGLAGADDSYYVTFVLEAAESDRDNNKASDKRRFVLRESQPFTVQNQTMKVHLAWAAIGGGARAVPKQEEVNEAAARRIIDDPTLPKDWKLVLERKATQDAKRPPPEQRSALLFQLYRYTRKQSSDYFIHKDLGGFLRRELDFYIKNEVLLLDNIASMDEHDFAAPLRKVRAMRAVALKIIAWLAQVEDFQKRLFLKKKLVLTTDLIVSQLDLRDQPSLMARADGLDGAMSAAFGSYNLSGVQTELEMQKDGIRPAVYLTSGGHSTYEWLSLIDNVAERTTGLLVKGDNHGALRLLRAGNAAGFDCVYIDPPYNTGDDGFIYKDSYQHSTWLSMMADRMSRGRALLRSTGAMVVSIDEYERDRLGILASMVFGETRYRSSFVWQKRDTPANDSTGVSVTHEYLLLVPKSDSFQRGLIPRTEEQLTVYKNPDNDARGAWTRTSLMVKNFVRGNDYAAVNPAGREVRPPPGMGWAWSAERMEEARKDGRLWWGQSGDGMPYQKRFLTEANDGVVPISWWSYEFASTNRNARAELRALFLGEVPFDTPKPMRLLGRVLQVTQAETILDFFAGSGTTGHAAIERIRAGASQTRFTLVESGDHFHTVLVPRILKATFASEWKDGKPVKLHPIKALYKIIELESYDDTLENLELKPPPSATQQALDLNAQTREDYLLRYALDLESQGSLLALDQFTKPWSYTIKVRKGGLVDRSPVDLVETFNLLLGLHVKSYDTFDRKGLLFVQGVLRAQDGETQGDQKVLVIWRDCEQWPADKLDDEVRRFFGRVSDDSRSLPLGELHAIYVNGDHHLENVVQPGGTAKILPIEETFHRLMFDTSDEV